jgi:hypothetical protein
VAEKEYKRKKEARDNFHRLLLSVADVSGDFGALVDVATQYPEQDINIVIINEVGCTAFTRACYRGFEDVVFGLLQWPGIDIHTQDIDTGNTALHHAAALGNRHIIEQLLVLGAKTTIPNHAGLLPVNLAPTEFLKQIIRMPSLIVHRDRYVLALKPKEARGTFGLAVTGNAVAIAGLPQSPQSQSSLPALPGVAPVGYVGANAVSGRLKISMNLNPINVAQLQQHADQQQQHGDQDTDEEDEAAEHSPNAHALTFRESYNNSSNKQIPVSPISQRHVSRSTSSSRPTTSLESYNREAANSSSSRPTSRAGASRPGTSQQKGFIVDLQSYKESVDDDLDRPTRLSVPRMDESIELGTTSVGIDADTEDFARGKFGPVPESFGSCRDDMLFSNCRRTANSIAESKELERLAQYYPQQFNVPNAFDHVEDWHEVKDYLWLLGYPYENQAQNPEEYSRYLPDKRYILHKVANQMDEAQRLFTEPVEDDCESGAENEEPESLANSPAALDTTPRRSIGAASSKNRNSNQHAVSALKFSVACKAFVTAVIELFEPEAGWPSSCPDSLSRLLLLGRAQAITRETMELLRKLLDFGPTYTAFVSTTSMQQSPMATSPTGRASTRQTTFFLTPNAGSPSSKSGSSKKRLLTAPQELLTAPCRYRRVAVDAMFEVAQALKMRAESQYALDSIRAHLWAHNGRKQLRRLEAGIGRERPLPVSGTAPGGAHSKVNVFAGLELWLQELKLSEYVEKFRLVGFRLLEDFLGLTLEDIEEFFPFMQVEFDENCRCLPCFMIDFVLLAQIGDMRRLARHCGKLTAHKIRGFEELARAQDPLDTVPLLPPPTAPPPLPGFLPEINSSKKK